MHVIFLYDDWKMTSRQLKWNISEIKYYVLLAKCGSLHFIIALLSFGSVMSHCRPGWYCKQMVMSGLDILFPQLIIYPPFKSKPFTKGPAACRESTFSCLSFWCHNITILYVYLAESTQLFSWSPCVPNLSRVVSPPFHMRPNLI